MRQRDSEISDVEFEGMWKRAKKMEAREEAEWNSLSEDEKRHRREMFDEGFVERVSDDLFGEEENGHLTLYEYLSEVRSVIENELSDAVWVTAEIASVNNSWPRGHCYLELVETDSSGRKIADARATIWRGVNNALTPIFRESTGDDLKAGIKVLVKIRPQYSEVYGLSLNILDIEPSFTLGDMEAQRRRTLARLEYEGLIDLNKELAIPVLPCRLAIVSAENAAGYGDFIKHLSDSGINFRTELFSAPMQGVTAPEGIAEAFAKVAERQNEFDVAVFIRGGGGALDLACFDDYLVAKAIAESPLPVISGIGHERDTHICDMVAAVRVKTPTGAADYLIGIFDDGREEIAELQQRLSSAAHRILEDGGLKLNSLISRISSGVAERISDGLLTLKTLKTRMNVAVDATLNTEKIKLERYSGVLRGCVYGAVSDNVASLERLKVRIYNASLAKIQLESSALDLIQQKIVANDPKRILGKGYGLVFADGEPVAHINQIKEGALLRILMKDGDAEFIATDVKNNES